VRCLAVKTAGYETGAGKAGYMGLIKEGCIVQSRSNAKAFRLVCK
jgi:hypothetical protein